MDETCVKFLLEFAFSRKWYKAFSFQPGHFDICTIDTEVDNIGTISL